MNTAKLSKIKKQLMGEQDGQDVLRLRTGTITVVNANGTVDLTLDGVTVAGIRYLLSAGIAVGTIVQIASYRGSLLVIGSATGTSQSVGGSWYAELTADQAANTSATGVTQFTFTLPAAGTYKYIAQFLFTTSTATASPGFALGGTAPMTSFRWASQVIPYSTTVGLEASQSSGTTTHPTNVTKILNNQIATNAGFGSINIRGRVTVTAGGTLLFRIGREAGTGNVLIKQSSNADVRWVNV